MGFGIDEGEIDLKADPSAEVVRYVVGIDAGFFLPVSVNPATGVARVATRTWGFSAEPGSPAVTNFATGGGEAERWAIAVALTAVREWLKEVPGVRPDSFDGGVVAFVVSTTAEIYYVDSQGNVPGCGDMPPW